MSTQRNCAIVAVLICSWVMWKEETFRSGMVLWQFLGAYQEMAECQANLNQMEKSNKGLLRKLLEKEELEQIRDFKLDMGVSRENTNTLSTRWHLWPNYDLKKMEIAASTYFCVPDTLDPRPKR